MRSTKQSTGAASPSPANLCPHRNLLASKLCRPQHACIQDRYARRIDRFLHWNPSLANDYVSHPHFEVRAIAAKSADLFRLTALLDDPEETVRWNAAIRLPYRYLLRMRSDPHREVRIRVAAKLQARRSAIDDGRR